jgi:hypothetical protein
VNIALGKLPASACPAFDPDRSGRVAITELIAAVAHALSACATDSLAPPIRSRR